MIPRMVLILLCLLPVAAIALMVQGNQQEASTKAFASQVDLRHALPVFPGAEGFGTDTPAGRGGAIVRVTTLAEDGPGSLREALSTAGPRTIVFEVGGIIHTQRDLVVTEPFVTVAGQTAPPPGVTIAGAGIGIVTNDVLIQHLRIRVGDEPAGPDPGGRDGIAVHQGGARVVIDHCSMAWAVDEGASTWGEGVHSVTFSHCIIGENLSQSIHPKGEHSKGLLIGDHTREVAVIRNLFAHNQRRNPLVKGDTSALVVNNLVYNPGKDAIRWSDPERSGGARSTVLNNVLLPGPDTGSLVRMLSRDIRLSRHTRIHEAGNLVERNGVLREAPRSALMGGLMTPEPQVLLEPLTVMPSEEVVETVLGSAGAWPSARDAIDARMVDSVREKTGGVIDSPSEVGGLPAVAPVVRRLELPANPNEDANGDGYTNLEEWLHQAAAKAEGRT